MTDIVDAAKIERLNEQVASLQASIARLREQVASLQATSGYESSIAQVQIERLEEALRRIDDWSKAYPLSVFPEPDLERAAHVLKANGMTLDAISAFTMRHCIEGVGKIARDALDEKS
jgi:multidrug resistance efflux pump